MRRTKGNSPDAPAQRLQYAPQGPVMAEFHRRRYKELVRGVVGPLGSSKTFGAINEILLMCHEQVPDKQNVRRSRWCIARNTFPDLNSATIPDVKSIVDRINPDGWNMQAPISWRHSYPRSDGTTVQLELMFRSFDGPQDSTKARGMQLTGTWVDEAGTFSKENLDMLIGRVKRYPAKAEVPNARFGVLFTSNAVARDHWLADAALGRKQDSWWIGIQAGGVIRKGNSWVENPLAENRKNLPKNYYLDQCANKKESWIRQNLANEFVVHVDGKPVHPDFNENLHVAPLEANYSMPISVGIDFGRTPAAVILQRQPNGQVFVLKEVVTNNMGADRFGRLLRKILNESYPHFKVESITGDPAGSAMAQTRDETPFDLLAANGIDADPAHTNDFEERVATLDNLLTQLIEGTPAFMVDPGCMTLIRGLAGEYCFRRLQVSGRDEYRDKQSKDPTSHACEALHYGLMGMGEGDSLFESGFEIDYAEVEDYAKNNYRYYE